MYDIVAKFLQPSIIDDGHRWRISTCCDLWIHHAFHYIEISCIKCKLDFTITLAWIDGSLDSTHQESSLLYFSKLPMKLACCNISDGDYDLKELLK